MSLSQLGIAAARGALGRTFLIEKRPDGVPRTIIIFDVVTSEIPEFEADVTLLPTEEGPEVTDHIQLKNPILKLEGSISQTPIDLEVQAANIASGGLETVTSQQSRQNFLNSGVQALGGTIGASVFGRSGNFGADLIGGLTDGIARTALLNAYNNRGRFSVVTKRQQYDDMVIQKISFPYNSQTGQKLDFSITFQQIRVARPFTVNIDQVGDSVVSSAAENVSKGSQTTQGVSTAQNEAINSSTLFRLIN